MVRKSGGLLQSESIWRWVWRIDPPAAPSTVKHFSWCALIVLLTLIVIKGLKRASQLWVTPWFQVSAHLFIGTSQTVGHECPGPPSNRTGWSPREFMKPPPHNPFCTDDISWSRWPIKCPRCPVQPEENLETCVFMRVVYASDPSSNFLRGESKSQPAPPPPPLQLLPHP